MIRHKRLMTGGDPAPVQPNDPVMEFMDATNQNLDVEIACAFDSTAVFENEYNVKMDCKSTKGTLIIQDESESEEKNVIDTVDIYDHSIPDISHNMLLKKRTTSNIKNIDNIHDEKELRIIKMREAIEGAEGASCCQNCKGKMTCVRSNFPPDVCAMVTKAIA